MFGQVFPFSSASSSDGRSGTFHAEFGDGVGGPRNGAPVLEGDFQRVFWPVDATWHGSSMGRRRHVAASHRRKRRKQEGGGLEAGRSAEDPHFNCFIVVGSPIFIFVVLVAVIVAVVAAFVFYC